jgi:hypothetical protein
MTGLTQANMMQFMQGASADPDFMAEAKQIKDQVTNGTMSPEQGNQKVGELLQKFDQYKNQGQGGQNYNKYAGQGGMTEQNVDAQGRGGIRTPVEYATNGPSQASPSSAQPRPVPTRNGMPEGIVQGSGLMGATPPISPTATHQGPVGVNTALPFESNRAVPRQPQNMPPKGLIRQGMDELKGAGKATQSYFDKLFNDPTRMALLQGGLGMMDPNSYYDKDGFGSLFTGLNKGLGYAQAGAQGVHDRRKTIADRKLAEAKTSAAGKGGKISVIEVGPNQLQMTQDGKLIGQPYAKGYAPTKPSKTTYKTIKENTEDGKIRNVNYRIDGDGNKAVESYSDIKKMVVGQNKDGGLAVQEYNQTTGAVIDIVLKETEFNPSEMREAVLMIEQLEDWETLIKENPISANEFPGKGATFANWFAESIGKGTPFKARAKLDTLKKQLMPKMTGEFLEDNRISETEWTIAKGALGMEPWATGLDKARAIPTLMKILRIKAGLDPNEKDGSDTTTPAPTAKPVSGGKYTPRSLNHLFKRKQQWNSQKK